MRARPPDLITALQDPHVYPHPVDRVELLETHISWVFLAGRRVYKIKKPVDLGFLNFTTLSRRRFFCREEVRLNRRLAPDVYLGRREDRQEVSDGREELLGLHRARYEPPVREPDVIRLETTGDLFREIERVFHLFS